MSSFKDWALKQKIGESNLWDDHFADASKEVVESAEKVYILMESELWEFRLQNELLRNDVQYAYEKLQYFIASSSNRKIKE